MFIGQAAKQSGATIKAIRHYQDVGLLVNVGRKGKYRTYSKDDVLTIKFIQMAQDVGFKLSELAPLLKQYNGHSMWLFIQELIQQKKHQITKQIIHLKATQDRLNTYEQEIDDCMSDNKNCKFP